MFHLNKKSDNLEENKTKKKLSYLQFFIVFILIIMLLAVFRVPYIGTTIDDYTFKALFGFFRFPVYIGCIYACYLALAKKKIHKFIRIRLIYIILFLVSITLLASIIDLDMVSKYTWLNNNNLSIVVKDFWNYTMQFRINLGSQGYLSYPITGILGVIYYWCWHHVLNMAWYYVIAFVIPLIILLISISGLITFRPIYLYVWIINNLFYIYKQKKLKKQISTMSVEQRQKYPFIENTLETNMDLAITQELGLKPTMNYFVPTSNAKIKPLSQIQSFSIFHKPKEAPIPTNNINDNIASDSNLNFFEDKVEQNNLENYAKDTIYENQNLNEHHLDNENDNNLEFEDDSYNQEYPSDINENPHDQDLKLEDNHNNYYQDEFSEPENSKTIAENNEGKQLYEERELKAADNLSNEDKKQQELEDIIKKSKKINLESIVEHDKYNIPIINRKTNRTVLKDNVSLPTTEIIFGNKFSKSAVLNFNTKAEILPNTNKNREADFAAIESGKNPYTKFHNSDASLVVTSVSINYDEKSEMIIDQIEKKLSIDNQKHLQELSKTQEIYHKQIQQMDNSNTENIKNDVLINKKILENIGNSQQINVDEIFNLPEEEKLEKISDIDFDLAKTNSKLSANKENIILKKDILYSNYHLPSIKILTKTEPSFSKSDLENYINSQISKLIATIKNLDIPIEYSSYQLGPSIIRIIFAPRESFRIANLYKQEDDLKFNLGTNKIAIRCPVNNTNNVAIDLPLDTKFRQIVNFKNSLGNEYIKNDNLENINVVLGQNLYGVSEYLDITKAPHVLIAGATGSGKSIVINVIISSIIMKYLPSDVRLLLIDPKQVELNLYDNIPHLIAPIAKNIDSAIFALKQLINEMDARYSFLAGHNCKNIQSYNSKVTYEKQLPYIVAIIDEFADLILSGAKDLETQITRLTQLARASGIHLILATQRPSVNVITGLIKSNIPTRISFLVKSQIDSRTILDEKGAEDLIGNGDMLFSNYGSTELLRIQGAYISDNDIVKIVKSLDKYLPIFDENYLIDDKNDLYLDSKDELYEEVKEYVKTIDFGKVKINPSLIMRRFSVGWNRARKILDQLESENIQNSNNNLNQ